MKKRLLFFGIPAILVATCVLMDYWRFQQHGYGGAGLRVVFAQTMAMLVLCLVAGAVLLLAPGWSPAFSGVPSPTSPSGFSARCLLSFRWKPY